MTGTFPQWQTDAIAPAVEIISASDIVAPATDVAGPSSAYSFPARSKSVGVAAFPGDQQQASVLYQLCPPPSTSHGYPQRLESFANVEQYEAATAHRRHSVYEAAEAASLFFEPATSAPLATEASAFNVLPAMVPILDVSAVDVMQLGVPVDFADNAVTTVSGPVHFNTGFDATFGARERAATTSLLAPQPMPQQLRSRSETASGVLSTNSGLPFTPEPAFLLDNGAMPSVLMRHMSLPDAGISHNLATSPVASSSRSPMSPPMPTFVPASYRPQTAPAYAAPPTEWCSDYPTGSFGVMRVSNMGYTSQMPLERASHQASVLAPAESCNGMSGTMPYAQQHAHKHLNFTFHAYSMPSGSPFDGSEQLFAPNGRILLACAFCKARKLRCDGAGPKCSQCKKRGMECQYPTTVRRRGKAKKTKLREAQEAAAKLQAEQKAAQGLSSTTSSRKRLRSDDEPAARGTLDEESGSESDSDELPPRRASMACVQGVNLLEEASQSRKRRRTDSV
jgi:hypothetical protein